MPSCLIVYQYYSHASSSFVSTARRRSIEELESGSLQLVAVWRFGGGRSPVRLFYDVAGVPPNASGNVIVPLPRPSRLDN